MVYFVEKPGYVAQIMAQRHTFESPMHEWKDSKSTLFVKLLTVADAFAAMFTFHFLHFIMQSMYHTSTQCSKAMIHDLHVL